MNRFPKVLAGLVLLSIWSCGGGSPGGATSSAAVSVSFAPDPVRAAPCPPSSCGPVAGDVEATGTVTLRETAGVAATVQSVAMEMRFGNGTVGRGEFDAASVTRRAGTTRLAAGASLAVPAGMHFTPASGLLPATWMLTVTLQDERGNRLTPSVTVAVQ